MIILALNLGNAGAPATPSERKIQLLFVLHESTKQQLECSYKHFTSYLLAIC